MDPITGYVVQAAAIVTAAAATYVAAAVRQVLQQVQANTTRSKRTRQLVTGEDSHLRGVLPRLRLIEERVLSTVRTVESEEGGE
ncbi:hypothetical protein [Haloarcula marina]|uniref:hypothetical protein n=1 Tax=Haloarcula marina TaxID=2961574 RepID=UPI0020B7AD11|nr:hypothetical protein [Halomicroarcula marina]